MNECTSCAHANACEARFDPGWAFSTPGGGIGGIRLLMFAGFGGMIYGKPPPPFPNACCGLPAVVIVGCDVKGPYDEL